MSPTKAKRKRPAAANDAPPAAPASTATTPSKKSPQHDETTTTTTTKREKRPKYSAFDLDNLTMDELRYLQGERLERFEAYRRSAVPKAAMKKLLMAMTGQTPDNNVVIVACGIAKLLVGELVEAGLRSASERGQECGPLRAEDIGRAYTSTLAETSLPIRRRRKRRLL